MGGPSAAAPAHRARMRLFVSAALVGLGYLFLGAEGGCNYIATSLGGELVAQVSCGTGVCRQLMPSVDASGQAVPCPKATLVTTEICDGLDNDCSGVIDNGCTCTAGSTQACYPGSVATRAIGACQDGVQICPPSGGVWSTCSNFVLPVGEVCGDALDNDCDNVIDNGCFCEDGAEQPCYGGPASTLGPPSAPGLLGKGVGPCHMGTQLCASGTWGACLQQVLPAKEICNGYDDNCDGTIDEGCVCTPNATQPCYTGPASTSGVGSCKTGIETCDEEGKSWGPCAGEVKPIEETCNGLDDDCNHLVDDAPTGTVVGGSIPCVVPKAQGSCSVGTTVCHAGAEACVAVTVGSPEVCNGLDDDCNGVVDEGVAGTGANCSITGQVGVCALGKVQCVNAQLVCVAPAPSAESCNGLDDDCNGLVDDSPLCTNACAPPLVWCSTAIACVDVIHDTANCGQCGHRCALANVATVYCASTCGVVKCNPHYDDCNGLDGDGCEVALLSDFANCGACGHGCSSGQICYNGVCQ